MHGRSILAALVAVSLLGVGCGGDDEPEGSGARPEAVEPDRPPKLPADPMDAMSDCLLEGVPVDAASDNPEVSRALAWASRSDRSQTEGGTSPEQFSFPGLLDAASPTKAEGAIRSSGDDPAASVEVFLFADEEAAREGLAHMKGNPPSDPATVPKFGVAGKATWALVGVGATLKGATAAKVSACLQKVAGEGIPEIGSGPDSGPSQRAEGTPEGDAEAAVRSFAEDAFNRSNPVQATCAAVGASEVQKCQENPRKYARLLRGKLTFTDFDLGGTGEVIAVVLTNGAGERVRVGLGPKISSITPAD